MKRVLGWLNGLPWLFANNTQKHKIMAKAILSPPKKKKKRSIQYLIKKKLYKKNEQRMISQMELERYEQLTFL